MNQPMNQPQADALIPLSALAGAYGIPRSTLQKWRDHVWQDVGDPPYSLQQFKIILEGGIEKSQSAIGASRNKHSKKIAQILKQL
jgi:hypothetical protein